MRWIASWTIVVGMLTPTYAANAGEPAQGAPYVRVVKDFVRDFAEATASNTSASSASFDERSAGVIRPGIFLHPQNQDDAVLAFPNVTVPDAKPDSRLMLVFWVGFRDDVPWDTDFGKPNGVRFLVAVDGTKVFSIDHAGVGWQPRAVDMTPWAGKTVAIDLRTNAIDGNSSYDWAVFGQPMLVQVPAVPEPNLDGDLAGLALATIECTEASDLVLSLGEARQPLHLDAGAHWIPMSFVHYVPMQIEVTHGAAQLADATAGAYESKLEFSSPELSSPLVTAGHPFNVILEVKNVGLGTHTAGGKVRLVCEKEKSLKDLGEAATREYTVARLAPGATQVFRWDGLGVPRPDHWILWTEPRGGVGVAVVSPEPELPSARPEHATVSASPGQRVVGVVANPWSRLSFLEDGHYVYGIAETWNGERWQRVATLAPLFQATVRKGSRWTAYCVDTAALESANAEGNSLVLTSQFSPVRERPWHMRLKLTPAANAPRIDVEAEISSEEGGELLNFRPLTVLAGDRAFGARKDFAIFPGLEYLEGDEPSSSERDLAPPLNDRRVPAAYKIATPLMAVQGDNALVALLWDENQEWAEGERHPAARFLAPKFDSGFECIRMSLLAPSVGKYIPENEEEARQTAFPMKPGQTVKLASCLVLDHASRYGDDSIVHGPHKGGLVLQAMQHWFDVYGFPEPSQQPREWNAERALCRDAYLHAVWGEDPPGWAHCAGWKPGAHVGYAVPLMIDLRDGVDEPERSEVQRRIDLVVGGAVKKLGKHYLWSNTGCHVMMAELPFSYGYLGESLNDFKQHALRILESRENGLWVWRPRDDKTATLGVAGDHTLGQASHPSYLALRAARMTGDPELTAKALEAMRQMERYEVPRGAQVWECPLYQPDILASAQAVRAYCEAYRITGDPANLAQARYWAWTGLPFLYTWELDGYPTMKYNVISVIGSTFYRHSWIGLPVVWCGLVYAYAIQDLAEFDTSFDWKRIAQGITNSAMWQQYTEGSSKGTYPDSWSMAKNTPNPANINPENIFVNEFRLRGQSPEIRCARFQGEDKVVLLNSAADISGARLDPKDSSIAFALRSESDRTVYSILATVPEPANVEGTGERVADSDALQSAQAGWLYDAELRGIILKTATGPSGSQCVVRWAN